MKKIFLALLLGFLPISASAISFDYSENLLLDNLIDDDFYGAGWTVDVLQGVTGDVIIAGGMVNITDNIDQDLIVFGGQVRIDGNIGDDLKIFGGEVELNGTVGDDVIGAGGNVTFTEKAQIGGSVNLSSFFTNFRGQVNENFSFRGGTLIFDGQVVGLANLDANVLKFGDNANIGLALNYTTPEEQSNLEQYVTGEIIYNAPVISETEIPTEKSTPNLNYLAILGSVLNLFIIALLIYGISPIMLYKPAQTLLQNPARSFIYGMEILIIIPLLSLILFITGWLIPLSFVITAIWFIVLYLSRIFVALAFGLLVSPLKNFAKKPRQILISYTLGLAIYELLVNIPLFGFLISILVTIFGAGALVSAKIEFFKNLCKKKII